MGSETILSDDTVNSIINSKKYIKDSVDLDNLPLSDDGRYRKKKYDLICDEYECK